MRLVLALLLYGAVAVHAAIETFDFDTEEQRLRYLEFARELRCPKCQNQNLADSNAPIAADLRVELHRLLLEGRSDQEIVDFMVSRYGEYVLYEPRLETKTLLLWGAPLLMLAGGLAVLGAVLRRSRAAATRTSAAAELSETERRRLDSLLGDGEKR